MRDLLLSSPHVRIATLGASVAPHTTNDRFNSDGRTNNKK